MPMNQRRLSRASMFEGRSVTVLAHDRLVDGVAGRHRVRNAHLERCRTPTDTLFAFEPDGRDSNAKPRDADGECYFFESSADFSALSALLSDAAALSSALSAAFSARSVLASVASSAFSARSSATAAPGSSAGG